LTRRYIALGATFAAIALSFVGVHRLEGHRLAQAAVILGYTAAILLFMRWANRAPAG